jgi:hypothetical protein
MTNNYNNEEDNIRAPDNVFRERLIDIDDYDEYDSWFQLRNNNNNDLDLDLDLDLEQAIAESFRIYNENNIWNDFDEEMIGDKEMIGDEEMKQNDLFPIFKLNIKKLIHFDKQLKELYEKILPILDLYERGEIDHHLMDHQEYQ